MKVFIKTQTSPLQTKTKMSEPIYISSSDEDKNVKPINNRTVSSTKTKDTTKRKIQPKSTPLTEEPKEIAMNEEIIKTKNINEIFQLFVNACEENILESDKEGKMIVKHLQKKHDSLKLMSRDYRKTITKALKLLLAQKQSVFSAINDVFTELRKNDTGAKRKIPLETITKTEPVVAKKSRDDVQPTKSQPQDDETSPEEAKLQRKIKKYETYLKKLNKEISHLQNAELSLDDLDQSDSAYMMESRLKKRAIQVHKKICDLRKLPEATGRIIEKKIRVQSSRFDEVNKKVEKYINGYKPLILQFPDYHDIVELVEKTNTKCQLSLTSSEVKEQATDVFKEVGRKLQKRRVKDFMYEFGENLPSEDVFSEEHDPANQDEELSKKLNENKNHFQDRTKEVFSKFTGIQKTIEETDKLSHEQTEDIKSDAYDEEDNSSDADNMEEDLEEAVEKPQEIIEEELTEKAENDEDEVILLD